MAEKVTKKKGYFEDKGYQPETKAGHGSDQSRFDRVDSAKEVPYSISAGKTPRPDVHGDDKHKERKGPKRTKKPLMPRTKDTQLRKAYMIRYILIGLGIIILLSSLVISYLNFVNMSDDHVSLERTGYDLMLELQDYDDLASEPSHGMLAWDVNKVLALTSDELSADLKPDVDYLIEIEDLSAFNIKYNRTLENQLAWSSLELTPDVKLSSEDSFSISMLMDIYVSTEEVHIARVTVTVWE